MSHLPVVLINGYTVSYFRNLWKPVHDVLTKYGFPTITVTIPPMWNIDERSLDIADQIKAAYPDQIVHLFGFGMGGLNARDIAFKSHARPRGSPGYLGFQVKTVTTIATPNQGIRLFDPINTTLAQLILTPLQYLGIDIAGVGDLSQTFVQGVFNPPRTNVSGIRYYSWAGQLGFWDWKGAFALTWPVVLITDGPNDGLVGVESAKWGTHLATIQHRSHRTIVNDDIALAMIPFWSAAEEGRPDPPLQLNTNVGVDEANLRKASFHALWIPFEVLTGRSTAISLNLDAGTSS